MLMETPSHGFSQPWLRDILLAGVWLVFVCGCGQSPSLDLTRKFQAAEKTVAQATTPADYQRAATAYQEILDDGFRSGVILFNQGNAWMQAGRRGRAIAAYRQAKRLLPRDPYLDANLRLAVGNDAATTTNVLDYVFFWQQSATTQEMSFAATLFLVLAMLASICVQLKYRPASARIVAIVSFCLLTLIAGSLLRDWWQNDAVRHGIVVATEVTARKGASNDHPASFNQALAEGTEFTVEGERDGWLLVRVGEKGEGWIPQRDCVVW